MIKFNNKPNKQHIINNKTIWESRSPAVVGIIIANYNNIDHVLINKRGSGTPNFNGYWNLPAGYLDWNENGYNGICREIYEETGIYVPNIINNFIILDNNMYQPFYVETEPTHLQNVSLSYGLYFKTDNLLETTDKYSEPDEIEDIKWIPITNINLYDFAFNHDKRILMYYNKVKSINENVNINFNNWEDYDENKEYENELDGDFFELIIYDYIKEYSGAVHFVKDLYRSFKNFDQKFYDNNYGLKQLKDFYDIGFPFIIMEDNNINRLLKFQKELKKNNFKSVIKSIKFETQYPGMNYDHVIIPFNDYSGTTTF